MSVQSVVFPQRLCGTLADDDARSHGVAGSHTRHDAAIGDSEILDILNATVDIQHRFIVPCRVAGLRREKIPSSLWPRAQVMALMLDPPPSTFPIDKGMPRPLRWGLQQQHADVGILGQAALYDRPKRARSTDDEVVLRL
jgi:hypothetical protein